MLRGCLNMIRNAKTIMGRLIGPRTVELDEAVEATDQRVEVLVSAKSGKPVKPRAPVPMKYRDPASGQSWTGRGRAPKWLEGKKKEDFLIKEA